MPVLHALLSALQMAALMGWEILWALILGFFISAAVQAVVSHREMARLLPDGGPASILKASALGAASSSCSYAAVAIARAMVRKGADFTAAMAFQIASTNLVLELGLVLAVLVGWRFTAATWVGGAVMVAVVAVLLPLVLRPRLLAEAKRQADKGVAGRMEGHAGMDMAVTEGPLWKRLLSAEGFTAASHYFWMDWASLGLDIGLGLLISGAIAAWVPHGVWTAVFASRDPVLSRAIGPLLGPLIGVATFVCSVGNAPLAAVLWNGGASFGGVVAFILADLIVLPILDIYRRYYGLKAAAALSAVLYAAMALAGYAVELVFGLLHLVPTARDARVIEGGVSLNSTTVLNVVFLILAAALLARFLATGGPKMLREMSGGGGEPAGRRHAH